MAPKAQPYREFFRSVTGYKPFPYQERMVAAPWPEVVDIPTGLGKTAAVVVAWLYRRILGDDSTGRRLVYCLPMRVLVEQTQREAALWCERASESFRKHGRRPPTTHVLMGGDVDKAWQSEPEADAILIGTQDMLLSRALNRGYAMRRYMWPMQFALINNDCLWVLDETQLMGVAVETSAQLHAFRQSHRTIGVAHTIWMSATLAEGQLATVDHPAPESGFAALTLDEADREQSAVAQRTQAAKSLHKLSVTRTSDKGNAQAREVAEAVVAIHQQRGGFTLVVVNRVDRAQALYRAISQDTGTEGAEIMLIHSRFRATERALRSEQLMASSASRIVIATQAIEAGVDISATTLVTELAPWSSLVQRLGRVNRRGEIEGAEVHWIDLAVEDDASLALPYETSELQDARRLLAELDDVGPASLRAVDHVPPPVVRPVLRRRDLIDLFDTTPDLCGDDIDVSRFIRESDDTDVRFFWRDFDTIPEADEPSAARDELCAASLRAAAAFLGALKRRHDKYAKAGGAAREKAARLRAYRWDPLDSLWSPVGRPRPGDTLLLHSEAGGYDDELGWVAEAGGQPVSVLAHQDATNEALGDDPDTSIGRWVELGEHLGHVEEQSCELAKGLSLQEGFIDAVTLAARWHDVGKSHPQFQHRLLDPLECSPAIPNPGEGLWAKSCHKRKANGLRPYFRHELASALAWLAHGVARDERQRRLVAYLIAAHHGKVRLSIRSMPGEQRPSKAGVLFARGIWGGDELPTLLLPTGTSIGPTLLDLSPMNMGAGSWLEASLALRDDPQLGPFVLAMLETVVRVADWRASKKEQDGDYDA